MEVQRPFGVFWRGTARSTSSCQGVAPADDLGLCIHRRFDLDTADRCEIHGIPVTDLIATLIDVTTCKPREQVERAIREADRLDLVDPVTLRASLEHTPRRSGIGLLRSLLDSETFSLTDSALERRFLRLIGKVDLPAPKTQVWLNGYRVDFYWSDLGLVVETDGLRYHRTPSQQKQDRIRDQAHTVAGLTVLHFTAAQVRYEPRRVLATLIPVVRRLQRLR